MLRRLKEQVTQAVSGVTPSEYCHEQLINENDTLSSSSSSSLSEGFLCPICMHSFESPEKLQAHFQVHAFHEVEQQKIKNSASSTSLGNGINGQDVVHQDLDVRELKLQLQDERRYSAELKKELERLHVLIANDAQIQEGEVSFLAQKVQMLEAAKAVATELVLKMKKETSTMNRQIEHLKQEKVDLIKKIGQLSTSITSKTDEIEDKNQEKTLLGDELVRYRQEIQNLEMLVDSLQKQLDQRPSEDDVSVLRKELVHAQQLMDTITQEKEREIKQHVITILKKEKDFEKLEEGFKELFKEIEVFKEFWEEKIASSNQKIVDVHKKIKDLEATFGDYMQKMVKNTADPNKLLMSEDIARTVVEDLIEDVVQKEKFEQKEVPSERGSLRVEKIEILCGKLQEEVNFLLTLFEEKKESFTEKSYGDKEVMKQMLKRERALERTVNELNELLNSLKFVQKERIFDYEESWKEKVGGETNNVTEFGNDFGKFRRKYASAEEGIKEESEHYRQMEEDCAGLVGESVAKSIEIETLELRCDKLVEILEEKSRIIEEKDKVIEKAKNDLDVITEKFIQMERKGRQLREECSRYQNDKVEFQNMLQQRESLIKELETRIRNMTLEFSDIKSSYEVQLSSLGEKMIKLKEESTLITEAMEKEMELLRQNVRMKSVQEKEHCEEIDKLKKELEVTGKRLGSSENIEKEYGAKLKDLSMKLEIEKKNFERSVHELNEELIKTKEQSAYILKEKDKKMELQKETISKLNEQVHLNERQLSGLQQDLEKLKNELVVSEKERHDMKDKTSDLNRQNLELRKELDGREKCMLQMKNDLEEKANVIRKLEKCEKDKAESLSEVIALLEVERSKLKVALKSVEDKEADLKQMKEELDCARVDVNDLKAVRREMERRKVEWLQEKRALQERCLTAESDLQFERERAAVNKRSFDDVQTAVQELGRVNQNLQMDFARHTTRKWLDDSEAVHCHGCDKPFTITNRKHHCRQCGQIFCATCSSFTAKIASFKNPVRVCNLCHEEIVHR